MATYTENFDLIKPDDEDYYDVADFNANMDIIDEALAQSVGGADKIGEPDDTVLNTVFGKMNGFISPDGQGVRIIKSIQHIVVIHESSQFSKTVTINTVDSSRCIVIMELLSYNLNSANYTLTDTTLTSSYTIAQNTGCRIGFWIIEFY